MVFSSAIFLFGFLPLTFLGQFLFRDIRWKNGFLLAASLLFYAAGEPLYVLLLLGSIAMNYGFGRLVARRRRWLPAAVVLNVLLLLVFKYTDFLLGTANALTGLSLPLPGIRLPIGISFFTFQALSYVIDVSRDPARVQRNPLRLALYISFFPQLIAGPIVQYGDIAPCLTQRRVTLSGAASGMRRFLFGLAKKILIANALGGAADAIFAAGGINAPAAWFGLLSYCLQIYYDFSGYSDMAIGLGRMFGFPFKENFDYPYAAVSLQDFWRRWHISLSTWFRDYVYIPLGGNRKGRARTYLNQFIVFFLTGLWHGASWNFVIWGLIHGTALTAEKAAAAGRKIPGWAGRVFALLVAALAFVFFRAETLPDAASYFASLFAGGFGGMGAFLPLLTPWRLGILSAGLLFSFPVLRKIPRTRVWECLSYAAAAVLLLLCGAELAASTFNPFIYFRF